MLLFDGYCPESLLQGHQVPMQLNTDDFWESPATRLQICVAPPHAVILRWRGKGQLRLEQSSSLAPDGLILTEACKEAGEEILPAADFLIANEQQLEWYLHEVCDELATVKAHQFDSKNPVFDQQRRHLATIQPEVWQQVFDEFCAFCNTGITINIRLYKPFQQWHHTLAQNGILFDFNWHTWHRGWINIRQPRFNYQKASLLELSMYLSAIFMSEPFDEGSIEFYFNNKTLEKIIQAIQHQTIGIQQ